MIINPYKIGSRSASSLRGALREQGVGCWTLQRQPKNPRALVINWGNSGFDYDDTKFHVINPPYYTGWLSNKIKFFQACGNDEQTLKWTTNRDKALEWNNRVFARRKVEASGGEGMVFFDPTTMAPATLPQAPLYTMFQPKTHEYRVHVARKLTGAEFSPILIQRKVFVKTPQRPSPTDWKIRNHANGFIFQTHPTTEKVPKAVLEAAQGIMVRHFPELHFAALDVMYHQKPDKAWVIEGNTAPGLENNSISVYAEYFKGLEKDYRQK